MNGDCHRLVANVALACLDQKERHILYPRWGGIESGATLSDDFRIMWEPISADDRTKQLVHRCYIDSDKAKDHGCVTRAHDHATGCIDFAEKSIAEGFSEPSEESDFLENLGMMLGITSHHIADMCTPVHVGHKMNHRRIGVRSAAKFHGKFERDMGRLMKRSGISIHRPQQVALDTDYFWDMAKWTYENLFLPLEDLYAAEDEDGITQITTLSLTAAVRHTSDVWHTILVEAGLLDREWTMQPQI